MGCDRITIDEIPSVITKIPPYLFWNCTSITDVNIMGDITTVGAGLFAGCSNLGTVDFTNCTAVPVLASANAFPATVPFKIVVPDALYDQWKTTTGWRTWVMHIIKQSDSAI